MAGSAGGPARANSASPAHDCVSYEPNNTRITAARIAPNRSAIISDICEVAGGVDHDWFEFPIFSLEPIRVRLTLLSEDFDLELYDPQGAMRVAGTTLGRADEEINFNPSSAGTYAVHVFPKAGQPGQYSRNPYALTITVGTPVSCGEWFEPNEVPAAGPSIAPATAYTGYICDAWDIDWFVLAAPAAGLVTVDLYGLPADYDLRLFSMGLVTLGQSPQIGTANKRVEYTTSGPMTLLLQVSGFYGAHSSTQVYNLRYTLGHPGSVCGEWFEPNDTQPAAARIEAGTSYRGYICDDSDEDWFKLAVPAGRQLTVDLHNLPADFDLAVHHPDGSFAVSSVENGVADERAIVAATIAGDYTIRVYGFSGSHSSADTYSLRALVGVAPGAGCGEWFEPNESFDAASAIQIGQSYSGLICDASDQDWFRFSLAAGDDAAVDLFGLPADYDLFVYNPQGTLVGESRAGGTGDERVGLIALSAGDYRARVVGYAGASDAMQPYSLRVTASAVAGGGCGESFEPNDTAETAAALQPATSQAGYICSAGDEDWFQLTAISGDGIDVALTSLPADYDVELRGPGGQVIGSSASGGRADEAVSVVAEATGSYHLRVYGYDGAFNATDTYELIVFVRSLPLACGDTFEPNEDFAAATAIQAGEPIWGHICTAVDEDWFKVTLRAGDALRAILDNLPADFDLELRDPNGAFVQRSADPGLTPAQIDATASTDGEYRLRVYGYSGSHDSGLAYRLMVTSGISLVTPTRTPTPAGSLEPSATPTATLTATATLRATATNPGTLPAKPTVSLTATRPTGGTPSVTASSEPKSTTTPPATREVPTVAPSASSEPKSSPTTAGPTGHGRIYLAWVAR
jgi:hypothetical protein